MSRIVLVSGPDPGHVLPVLGVARALRARGHETVVATGTQRQALVEDEGHSFVELPLLAPTAEDEDFGHVLWHRAGQMAPPLRALLAPLRPDLLVVDTLTSVGGFVADLLGVLWVEVSPHHLMDPDPQVPPVGLGARPSHSGPRRRAHDRIRAAQASSVAEGHALRDEVRATLGLGPPAGPVLRLLQTLPGLEPPRSAWPADAHVVGQLAIDPPGALPPLPPGDGPLVVVTDTTASGLRSSAGALAVEGLGGDPSRRVVVTTRVTLDPVPANVVVAPAPHGPLLDVADVAVGPGGGGFTAKALSRGVPLVVLPAGGDQRETAARVERSGAGAWFRPGGRHEAQRLARTVDRLLRRRRVRRAAARLAAGAAGLGPGRAADLVEAVLAGSVPVATGP